MSPTTHRISVSQIKRIAHEYKERLPGWQQIRPGTLGRTAEAVAQCIGFERLSTGTYRPVGFLRVLAAPDTPGVMELPQHLNVKLRQITETQHEKLKEQVLDAMRREFVPSLDRPLDPASILERYEREAVPTSAEAYSLCALNAYYSRFERARFWRRSFAELVLCQGSSEDWDRERQSFLDELEQWIQAGCANQRLPEVVKEEKRKLGFE